MKMVWKMIYINIMSGWEKDKIRNRKYGCTLAPSANTHNTFVEINGMYIRTFANNKHTVLIWVLNESTVIVLSAVSTKLYIVRNNIVQEQAQ